MAETNMRKVYQAVAGDLMALAHVIGDLAAIEEQMAEETLFPHFQQEVAEVHQTLRLVFRRLGELHDEYGMHADARDPAADPLGTTKVIDQPVSPATPPKENPHG
jgi:hypothetical protein